MCILVLMDYLVNLQVIDSMETKTRIGFQLFPSLLYQNGYLIIPKHVEQNHFPSYVIHFHQYKDSSSIDITVSNVISIQPPEQNLWYCLMFFESWFWQEQKLRVIDFLTERKTKSDRFSAKKRSFKRYTFCEKEKLRITDFLPERET